MSKCRRIAVLVVSFLGIASVAHADTFLCGFIQEKYPTGKANQASCSMLPGKVYSTRFHTPGRSQHCKVESVYSYEDLQDALVDVDDGTVSWVRHYALTDEAKPKQKAYYIKQGMDEQEAEKKTNLESKRTEVFRIVNRHVSST